MVIDTSAMIAILQGEPEHRILIDAIEAADSRRMSVATLVKCSIVLEARYGAEGTRDLDRFISKARVELVAVEQGQLARGAFNRFGKGRHRAALNYGDCFSYALAAVLNEPLLFKGDGFAHKDIMTA